MNLLRIIAFSVVAVLLILVACCGKHRSPGRVTQGPLGVLDSAETEKGILSESTALTEEHYRFLAMPYEECLAYLEDKVKQLIYEMHGIVIEETASAA